MYTQLIVPLDESSVAEQVLPYARYLTEGLKVPLELITAVDVAGIATSNADEVKNFSKFVGDIRMASETYLNRIAKMFPESAVTCSVNTGKPEAVIIEKAKQNKGTLIAMATHGRSGLNRWFLGSVAEKVLRGTSNPLLLVRAVQDEKANGQLNLQSIIVPLDTSEAAETALSDATELAKRLNASIILAHVYNLPLASYFGSGDYYNPRYKSLATQLKGESHKYLEEKVADVKQRGLEKVAPIFLEGSPAEEIIALGRRHPNSLIAMTTHGRSGLQRWVLGSVTEKVVRGAENPVLVVRGN